MGKIKIIFLWVILIVLSCEKREEEISEKKRLPSQITINFELLESATGKQLFKLFAQKALLFEEEKRIYIYKPIVYFFDEEKRVSAILECDSGIVDQKNYNLFGFGSIVVRTNDSTYLFCDSLRWDNQRQMIFTNSFVRFRNESGEIEGIGLESDAALSKVKILKEVTGKAK
ncbi:MAG: LPS export ABC transporter periplasmic protein LptC [candidate division WOR-3 bacterium]|uniref:LPS export ABC transporter periplasmic protein LptC n=1 Tax=candidate division WOR-3 bacterium TaxID=2052148 RepID=A0A7C4S1F3_UNCW3